MKEITMYECEICNEAYREYEEAHECESRGKEISLVKVGGDVEYEITMGGGFGNIYIPLRVKTIEDTGHYFIYRFEEEYDNGEWDESMHSVYGNDEFNNRVTIK